MQREGEAGRRYKDMMGKEKSGLVIHTGGGAWIAKGLRLGLISYSE